MDNLHKVGDRVEVLWHRGDPGTWYRGTMLEGGRVQFDDPYPFVGEGTFVLEPEEIAQYRPGTKTVAHLAWHRHNVCRHECV